MLSVSRLCGRTWLIAKSTAPQTFVRATLKTTPPVAVTKTPIQEWGWSYLVRQKALKRPISPHLSVYKPMLTWMVSGAHRVGGMAMGKLGCVQHSANVVACGGVIVVSTLMVAPFDFTDCVVRVKSWELPRVLIGAFKFIVALPIVFHTLNGIRFLGFDMAKGVGNIHVIYRTGWAVVALSFILAAYFAFIMPTTLVAGAKIEQKK